MQHALGFAGGTGGVEDEQWVLGAHRFRWTLRGLRLDQFVIPDIAFAGPGDLAAGAAHHDDLLHRGRAGLGQGGVCVDLQGYGATAPQPFVSRDQPFRLSVLDAARERIRRESAEHH